MMAKKYLYSLVICLTLLTIFVPRLLGSSDPLCSYHPEAYQGLELGQLSQELTNTGLIGRVHGVAGKAQMYVMSVREPDNFFSHREFSLLAKDQAMINTLNQVNRHDRICIQGDLITNPSPQEHITVNSLEILEPWAQPEGFTPYKRQVDLPRELQNQTSFIGKVHAIGEGGKILVVEYQDGVIPIFVTATEYTQNLYRGDIVKLHYQIQQIPHQPTHLKLDTAVEKPLEVIDAIATWNNQAHTLRGKLVKFPQSPQLKFDVFAMEVDVKGIKRYFTLVNFDDIAEFENIRTKLTTIWDNNLENAISGRNMLINPKVTMEAQGLTSVISPEQANPQILLDNAAQVQQVK